MATTPIIGAVPVEMAEAVPILNRVLDGLSLMFAGASGRAEYGSRNAIGDVRLNGENYLISKTLAAPLLLCFSTTLAEGATWSQFNELRAKILSEKPVMLTGVLLVQLAQRYCLSQMARILAATDFVSRDDANTALARMSALYDPEVEAAADQHDSGTYQALIALYAATVRDLASRALLLPQVVIMEFGVPAPALWLAQRIYQDGSRADEMVAENRVINPCFMPRTIRVLAA
jgi:hypothetical protein